MLQDESWLVQTSTTWFHAVVNKYNMFVIPVMLFVDQVSDIIYANDTTRYAEACWIFVIIPAVVGILNMIYSSTRLDAVTPDRRLFDHLKE